MIGNKKYLSMQAWATTVYVQLLNITCDYWSILDKFKFIFPGISVALSYVTILFFARFSLPSVNEIRINRVLDKKRKAIQTQLKNAPTRERTKYLKGQLEEIDNIKLEILDIQFNLCRQDHKSELSSKSEKN